MTDRLLINFYEEWKSTLCPGCGRPYADHANQTADDWVAMYKECPAIRRLDIAQQKEARVDKVETESGFHPSRRKFWEVVTREEALLIMEEERKRNGIHGSGGQATS